MYVCRAYCNLHNIAVLVSATQCRGVLMMPWKLILLDECMTLWGEPEGVHMQKME